MSVGMMGGPSAGGDGNFATLQDSVKLVNVNRVVAFLESLRPRRQEVDSRHCLWCSIERWRSFRSCFLILSAAGPSTFASGLSGVGKMGSITMEVLPLASVALSLAPLNQRLQEALHSVEGGGLTHLWWSGSFLIFGGVPGQSDDPYDIPLDLTKIKN